MKYTLINKLLLITSMASVLTFMSCGDDSEPAPPENQALGAFSVSVSDITLTSASLEWTQAIDPDGDAVTYTVVINGSTLASSISSTSAEITGLDSETSYSGTVTADDGNGGTNSANFSFVTNGNQNPEMFTVAVNSITATTADLAWTTSVDPDGDDVTYRVILDGSEVANNLNATNFSLTELMA